MERQGEGGGLKILRNEETSFMDDPLSKRTYIVCFTLSGIIEIHAHEVACYKLNIK